MKQSKIIDTFDTYQYLISLLYNSSVHAATLSTTFPLLLRGDVSPPIYFVFYSSLTVCDVLVVHDATATTLGSVRV